MKFLYTVISPKARAIAQRYRCSLVGLIISAFFLIFQDGKAQSYEIGGLAGLNFSNIVGADVSGNGVRTGFHLGGYAHFEFNEDWGFRPEILLYSQKGTSSGGFSSSYLEIPLMATYSFDDKFMAMAGIQPSFLYNAKVSDGRGDISNLIRTLDMGIVLAAWYQINEKWGIGGRIVPGISRVGESGEEQTYNFNVQFSAGYRFM